MSFPSGAPLRRGGVFAQGREAGGAVPLHSVDPCSFLTRVPGGAGYKMLAAPRKGLVRLVLNGVNGDLRQRGAGNACKSRLDIYIYHEMQGWLATRSGVCVCNCYCCCDILLLLRHIIIKRWRHIIMKAMERVQLVDQVRTAGESVDAAHIDEKRSKRRVE